MSKNMNDKGKKKPVELDPSLYGYKLEDKVEISGQALLQLITTLDELTQNAIEPVVEYSPVKEGENFVEWMKRIESTEKIFVPKKVHNARSLAMYLSGIHQDNVNAGKATHIKDLNKAPKDVDFPKPAKKEEEAADEKPVVKSE